MQSQTQPRLIDRCGRGALPLEVAVPQNRRTQKRTAGVRCVCRDVWHIGGVGAMRKALSVGLILCHTVAGALRQFHAYVALPSGPSRSARSGSAALGLGSAHFGRNSFDLDQDRADFAQLSTSIGPLSSKPGAIHAWVDLAQISSDFGHPRPTLVRSADYDINSLALVNFEPTRFRSNLCRCWPLLVGFNQFRSEFDKCSRIPARRGPMSAECGPNSTRFGPIAPKFDQVWTQFGESRNDFGRTRRILDMSGFDHHRARFEYGRGRVMWPEGFVHNSIYML